MNTIIYILIIISIVLTLILYKKNVIINEPMTNVQDNEESEESEKTEVSEDLEDDTINIIYSNHDNNIIETTDFKDGDIGYRGHMKQDKLKRELDIKTIL